MNINAAMASLGRLPERGTPAEMRRAAAHLAHAGRRAGVEDAVILDALETIGDLTEMRRR